MNRTTKRIQWALLLALVLALAVVGGALAITINVDGDEEAVWTAGAGGQLPGNTTDPNEGGITDNRDISAVYWTNDGSNFYLMIRTHGIPPSLSSFPPPATDIFFCIDNDNNPGTGGSFANCNNMTGIDRFIFITGTSAPEVFNGSFVSLGTGTLGYDTGAPNPVVELSVPNSLLGLSAANCTQTMPMAVFFDNGTGDPDDTTPDAGTVNIGCGSPTAITLENLSARADNSAVLSGVIVGAAILIFALGISLRFRKKRAQS